MKREMFTVCMVVCSMSFVQAAIDYTVPLTADSGTVVLWHMDSTYVSGDVKYTPNDPVGDGSKDVKILLPSGGTPPAPGTLVAGPTAALGNAISFGASDPLQAFQTTVPVWNNSYEQLKIEAWLKIDAGVMLTATKNIVEIGNIGYLQKWTNGTAAEIGFVVNFSDGTNGQRWITGIAAIADKWLHITAEFDAKQQINISGFTLDGTYNQSATRDYTGKMLKDGTDKYIYAGWKNNGVAFDDIRISSVPEPATCVLLGLGALLLRKKF